MHLSRGAILTFDVNPGQAKRLPFVAAWTILLLLAAASAVTAFLRIGIWSAICEFSIAAIQVAVLFILFMRLKGLPSLKWVFAGAGFFWLLFLFGLSATDYSNRNGWPPQQSQGEH